MMAKIKVSRIHRKSEWDSRPVYGKDTYDTGSIYSIGLEYNSKKYFLTLNTEEAAHLKRQLIDWGV